MLAAFAESAMIGAGFGGGPVNVPLAHLAADAVIAMNLLIENKGDVEASADALHEVKATQWIDPEIAAFSANTVARKAEQVRRGPVTKTIVKATDGIRANALLWRAQYAYDELSAGKTLEDICSALDKKRQGQGRGERRQDPQFLLRQDDHRRLLQARRRRASPRTASRRRTGVSTPMSTPS